MNRMVYEHGGRLKENTVCDHSVNLNPLGCPDKVKEALVKAVDEIQRYPDAQQRDVRTAIAGLYGLNESNVVCGNGASELITAVCQSVRPKKALLISPSFYGYERALSGIEGCRIRRFTLDKNDDFALGRSIFDELTDDTDIVFICNPNNPTGRLTDPELLKDVADRCEEKQIVIVADECFLEMSDDAKSMSDLVRDHKYLYVINAFTKTLAIPGVRFGYALSDPENIQALIDILPEWNLSVFAQKAALAGAEVIGDGSYLTESRRLIAKEREYLTTELSALGIKVYKSEAPFILAYTDKDIGRMLEKNGILIRDCDNFDSLKKGHYRIAVRDHEDDQRLIECLRSEIEH